MEILDRIAATSTIEALKDLMLEAIAPDGFDAAACGAFLPAETGPTSHFFFTAWPPAWIELYVARNFVANDFGVAEARRRIAPFTWLEVKAERRLTPGEEEVWRVANEWGWVDGFSVPIHGPAGYFGLIAMAATRPVADVEVRRRLHLIGFHTHEQCRRLTRITPVRDGGEALSEREIECLRWAVAGKSDWETAVILGLSPTTVKFHIDKARRKLGVKTRAQAVFQLTVRGWL